MASKMRTTISKNKDGKFLTARECHVYQDIWHTEQVITISVDRINQIMSHVFGSRVEIWDASAIDCTPAE